ncbi:MAG: hypothetical protein QM708_09230 [Propioniciclava sp.]|uniref:hypothetical protein n=1 Tax=Propioniciclava sp. TaxID=2038686 RepID=UPI0039E6A3B5
MHRFEHRASVDDDPGWGLAPRLRDQVGDGELAYPASACEATMLPVSRLQVGEQFVLRPKHLLSGTDVLSA